MLTKNEIILQLLLPKFKPAIDSRFISLFQLNKNKKINYNNYNSYDISIEKILNGEDKRTSIILKNIPFQMTKKELNDLLEGIGNINYLYLPFDKNSKKNLGFGYVNLVNFKNVINLCDRIKEYNLNNKNLKKNIEIYYSKPQGKLALTKMFEKREYSKNI
jgi:RNA recognition motif-containing protein